MTPDSLTVTVVSGVATAVVGALAFFMRQAFAKMDTTLDQVNGKLDGLTATMARGDGDRRVLEVEVRELKAQVVELKREVRELSEGMVR